MTFPSTLKKSGLITISKTGSGSKASSPGSPRSPASPLNTSVKKIVSESSAKAPPANKASEKTSVVTSVKKVTVSSKSSSSKSAIKPVVDVKAESVKTTFSATKGVTKSVTKPPPLKLNMKVIDVDGLQSPVTPKSPLKSIPKTPTTPSLKKSLTSTKSPMANNSVSAAKSPLLSGVKSPSSPLIKPSKVSTVALVTKSQVSSETKSSTVKSTSKSPVSSSPVMSSKMSGSSKAFAVSLPVAKCSTLVIPKTSKITTAPKSPLVSVKPAAPTVKSVISKTVVKENSLPLALVPSKTVTIKPTSPVNQKADALSKNVSRVKLTMTTNKSTTTSKSPSTVSSTKVITLKPSFPSKLLTKEPSAVKTANNSTVATKSNVVSKSELASKGTLNKEDSTYSLSSVNSSLLLKSTASVVPKSTTSNATVTSSIAVSKNSVPKSPITITKPSRLTVAKSPSSPTVKTLPSPVVKTPLSPTVKARTPLSPTIRPKTPLSPIVRPRTASISVSSKPPMSPARPKLLPTKLILSPSKSKLSSSRLNSTSTESLALRTSLKSPMSPKPLKLVPKSLSRIIKKTEVPPAKSIRGGQPIQKTIVNPEINELPTNKVINLPETSDMCKLENLDKNNVKEVIESPVTQTSNLNLLFSKTMEINKTGVVIENDLKTNDAFTHDDVLLSTKMLINADNGEKPLVILERSRTKEEEVAVEFSSIVTHKEQKQDENSCSLLDFVVVTKDECMASLNSISQSVNNCNIVFDDHHFNSNNGDVVEEQFDEAQLCSKETEDKFETMNDKLVLGDVPFESDISDCEQASLKEPIKTVISSNEEVKSHCVGDVFLFTNTEDLSFNDLDRADSTDNFIHQFMPKLVDRSGGASSVSTDDGSLFSRKSYSEVVVGSPKDTEFYFEYDFDLVDDCLDYDDESSVFVEVTEKEFPELKPKDLSCKRKNKKQKKRTCNNRTESLSDSNSISEEINFNSKDFDGNEFNHYIKMMKDCSFYPSGLFSSDSVKLSTSSPLSWLEISVRTTDDDLVPSTESLSTYEIFQASSLNKDFLTSVIGYSTATTSPSNESSWSWKSIEGRQSHIKTNITLSLQPRSAHLNTPRFMLLLALISEAKGYEIQPSLSEHFVTTDCMSRFDSKIRRLMVQGFWLVGRLIKESLSEDKETHCGNPFGFADGDIGYWWAGINMLDWQEYLKECGKNQTLTNCYQFVMDNIDKKRQNSSEALLSMNTGTPEEFMSEADVDNFIHTVRNVKYYSGNCFVDSEENFEKIMTEDDGYNDDNAFTEWGSSSAVQQN